MIAENAPSRAAPARRGLKWFALAAVSMLAVYVLAHLALLWRFPWFVDETYFAMNARIAQGDPAQRFVALADHKGLGFSWLGALLIHFDIAPVTALRLISIASGAIGAGSTGFLVWRWRGSLPWALAASGLVAFVPYLFVTNSVGIIDPFVAGGSMVALALQLELARRSRLDLALILGVTLGLLLLAKPTSQLVILLLPLSLAMFDWRHERRWRRLAGWAALVVLTLVIAACMYAVTRLSPLAYTPAPPNHRTVSEMLHDPFALWGKVAPGVFDAMWGYLTPPGAVLACWGVVCAVLKRDRLGLIVTVWVLAGIAAFLFLTDSAYPRYGLQAVAPICVLIVIGGQDLWGRARGLVAWPWVAGAAVLAAAPLLVLDARVLLTPQTAPYAGLDYEQYVKWVSNQQPTREAAQLILQRAPSSFTAATPDPERTLANLGGWPWTASLVLNGTHYTATPRFLLIDGNGDQTVINQARFVIIEGITPTWLQLGNARLVKLWSRPQGGPTLALYDRGG